MTDSLYPSVDPHAFLFHAGSLHGHESDFGIIGARHITQRFDVALGDEILRQVAVPSMAWKMRWIRLERLFLYYQSLKRFRRQRLAEQVALRLVTAQLM